MRIAEICFSPSWGGIEHYHVDMADRLRQRGHYVVPFCRKASPIEKRLFEAGFDPICASPTRYLSPHTTLKLACYFRKHKIQSIHLHRTHDLGVVLPAADLAGVPVRVFTLQMESGRKKRDLYHRYVYSRLTRVLTITDRIREKTISSVVIKPEKVCRLYYGIDIDLLHSARRSREEIREKWKIPKDAFVVGLTGRLDPAKGQDLLIEAAKRVSRSIPELYIILVGEETVGQHTETTRLKKLADSFPEPDRVIFTGYQSPPGTIVPAFDVAVLATKRESFGLVVIEAMALGIPVIASADGGVLEIITHGENGLLFPPGDVEILAERIQYAYTRKAELKLLAARGMETVETKFSMEDHLAGLERALKGF